MLVGAKHKVVPARQGRKDLGARRFARPSKRRHRRTGATAYRAPASPGRGVRATGGAEGIRKALQNIAEWY